jgi:hypothetical protein
LENNMTGGSNSALRRVYLVGAGISNDPASAIMAAGRLLDSIFRWAAGGDVASLSRTIAANPTQIGVQVTEVHSLS